MENTTKGATTKLFFPKEQDRLKIRINSTPKFKKYKQDMAK